MRQITIPIKSPSDMQKRTTGTGSCVLQVSSGFYPGAKLVLLAGDSGAGLFAVTDFANQISTGQQCAGGHQH